MMQNVAVRAGLAILEGMPDMNHPAAGPKLSAGVGIDSGLVVVGRGGSKEIDAFGVLVFSIWGLDSKQPPFSNAFENLKAFVYELKLPSCQ